MVLFFYFFQTHPCPETGTFPSLFRKERGETIKDGQGGEFEKETLKQNGDFY